jgi:hypothetical protein
VGPQHSNTCIEAKLPKKEILLLADFDVMSFIKGHLKAARDHIGKKDYLTAKNEAIQVLEFEPDNYNALAAIRFVFSLTPLTRTS